MNKKWIITDLDGVIMGRMREKNGGDTTLDYSKLLKTLSSIKNYELIFLSDRGVEQLAPLAYLLNASPIHGGESGAAAYLALQHRSIINSNFFDVAQTISEIKKQFENQFKNKYPLEPGVITSIRIERINGEDLSIPYNFLASFTNDYLSLTISDHGDCISLKPRDINKQVGIKWLTQLYKDNNNPIDYPNSIWIGDGKSDIVAAEFVKEHGGKITGVANSHPEYKDFIVDNNGYISSQQHTNGMNEILRNVL